jgi:hypothetical protein
VEVNGQLRASATLPRKNTCRHSNCPEEQPDSESLRAVAKRGILSAVNRTWISNRYSNQCTVGCDAIILGGSQQRRSQKANLWNKANNAFVCRLFNDFR